MSSPSRPAVTSGAAPPPAIAPASADAVLAGALETARSAAVDAAESADAVGDHLGVRPEPVLGDVAVATHAFDARQPGYRGWHWAVTVSRVADEQTVTVDEVVLLPGTGALLAPAWVPWSERVQPGDLSPGDLLPPPPADDPRLVPGYVQSDDPEVEQVAFELGVGRVRVLSREGRELAAERWSGGDRGPDAPMARQAPAACGTCGFFLPLAGVLRAGFGVCGNERVDTDGQVVAVEYGCGAHSEVRMRRPASGAPGEVVYDDGEIITPSEPREQAPESDGASETAVAVHDGQPEAAEQGAGETGPEPEPVVGTAEPAPEGQ